MYNIALSAGRAMMECPRCGRELKRIRRTALQRFFFSDAFACHKCGYRTRRVYPFVRVNAKYLFSRHTHCIKCGTARVYRLSKRDRVDSMSKHVFSLLQQVTLAPVNKCLACRLQYYDWRPPEPRSEASGPQ
jgi:predicted RNA-binding Zn-ribbon protein involved in translation (DUF1610 family)